MKLKGDKKMRLNTIYNEDCLEGMKRIPDKSIDMILCDLPYGTTACKWDEVIPFEPLWEQYERVIKDNGAIVLTASQPFTTKLIASNFDMFKHEWVWIKSHGGFATAKFKPLKRHEDVLVFSKGTVSYHPQMVEVKGKVRDQRNEPAFNNNGRNKVDSPINPGTKMAYSKDYNPKKRYPKSHIEFSNRTEKTIHPTQKPVPLFEYLIKTYTNKGETVLDNCMGSGTTAIACLNTDRQYIGFELDETYHKLSLERIENHAQQLSLI